MENLTDLLKKATVVKNEAGYIAAINYLKGLMIDNDLREKDAMHEENSFFLQTGKVNLH